jgi:hypothetical protein
MPRLNSAKKVTTEPRFIRPQRIGSSTFSAPATVARERMPRNSFQS